MERQCACVPRVRTRREHPEYPGALSYRRPADNSYLGEPVFLRRGNRDGMSTSYRAGEGTFLSHFLCGANRSNGGKWKVFFVDSSCMFRGRLDGFVVLATGVSLLADSCTRQV